MNYTPTYVASPIGTTSQFEEAFDQPEWGSAAACLVIRSHNIGRWSAIPHFHDSYSIKEMIRAGYMNHTSQGYSLTEKAIKRLVELFPENRTIPEDTFLSDNTS